MIRRYSIIYEPQLDFSCIIVRYYYGELSIRALGMLLQNNLTDFLCSKIPLNILFCDCLVILAAAQLFTNEMQ